MHIHTAYASAHSRRRADGQAAWPLQLSGLCSCRMRPRRQLRELASRGPAQHTELSDAATNIAIVLLKAAAAQAVGAVFGRPRSRATRLPASAAAARRARAAPPPRPPRAASPGAAPRPPAPPAGRTARCHGVSAVCAPVASVPAAVAGARAPGTSSSVDCAAPPLAIPTRSGRLMGRESSCCRQRRPGECKRLLLSQRARHSSASWGGAFTACRARSLRPTSSARSARDGPPSNLPLAC